jgi:hypothetical protein
MVEALVEFRAASEANDLDRFVATLAPDAELVSPPLARGVIRGRDDLRWTEEIVAGNRGVMVAEARIGPFKIDDAMVFELDPDGRIKLLRPHLRPLLATVWLALVVGAKVMRHPGLLRRAVSRA